MHEWCFIWNCSHYSRWLCQGGHVGTWCAHIAVTRRLWAHIKPALCWAHGDVQQVSQGVMDHANILRGQHHLHYVEQTHNLREAGSGLLPATVRVSSRAGGAAQSVCVRWAVFPVYTKAPSPPQAVSFLLEWLLFLYYSPPWIKVPMGRSPEISKPRHDGFST